MHKSQDLTGRRWLILAISCLVNLCAGSLYAWSVFSAPMAEYLQQFTASDIPDLAVVFTVANAVGPFTMISGGRINDKLGPRWVLVVGGILLGGGMIGCGMARSFTALLLSYGLGVGLGVGMIYGTIVSNTIKFFPDHRGMAGGITTAVYGSSSILIPPVANKIIEHFSVSHAFILLGTAMLAAVCISSFFIIPCPKGFAPVGWKPPETSGRASARDYDFREMLASPVFYIMIVVLLFGAFAGLMITSQASPMAQNLIGMDPQNAALAVSILALFNTAGRIASGTLSDKIGTPNTLAITFTLSAAALLLMTQCQTGSSALFLLCISLVGFGFGSIMGVYPGFPAMQFGSAHNSVNYGIMFIGFALAGAIGPTMMGQIRGITGQYQPAFLISAGLNLLGLGAILCFKKLLSPVKK